MPKKSVTYLKMTKHYFKLVEVEEEEVDLGGPFAVVVTRDEQDNVSPKLESENYPDWANHITRGSFGIFNSEKLINCVSDVNLAIKLSESD